MDTENLHEENCVCQFPTMLELGNVSSHNLKCATSFDDKSTTRAFIITNDLSTPGLSKLSNTGTTCSSSTDLVLKAMGASNNFSNALAASNLNPKATSFFIASKLSNLNPLASSFSIERKLNYVPSYIAFILLLSAYIVQAIILSGKTFEEGSIENVSSTKSILDSAQGVNEEGPRSILRTLKTKNADRPVIAHLNINFIAPKFEYSFVKDNVDLLMVSETKIDDTFSKEQFNIEGYSRPIRLDRNCHGGGIIFFIRDDLPCHELSSHKLPNGIECTFLEMTIRKSKWLNVGGYNPHKEKISIF